MTMKILIQNSEPAESTNNAVVTLNGQNTTLTPGQGQDFYIHQGASLTVKEESKSEEKYASHVEGAGPVDGEKESEGEDASTKSAPADDKVGDTESDESAK